MPEEKLFCSICERDIREEHMYPIYSKKFEIICSQCCLLGALYMEGKIPDSFLLAIPEKIRLKITQIYDKHE